MWTGPRTHSVLIHVFLFPFPFQARAEYDDHSLNRAPIAGGGGGQNTDRSRTSQLSVHSHVLLEVKGKGVVTVRDAVTFGAAPFAAAGDR